MRRLLAVSAVVVAFGFGACGDDEPAAQPTPTVSYAPGAAPAYQQGGLLGPAGDARNTVDQLDQQQQQQEANSGGGALVPEAADTGDALGP
jgi:hypothetical protein